MADVVKSFEKLLNYGAPANDSCNDGTLFRFEGERWFFLSNADKDALRARLSQAGAGGAVLWPIETDDQVEALARECEWDNRKYMTPADYAIWCERMRKFARLAALAPSPSAGEPMHHDPKLPPGEYIVNIETEGGAASVNGPVRTTPPATPVQPTARVEAVAFPAYGEMPFIELGSAVKAAQFGTLQPYEFDPEFYPGHQIVGTINFNSLNRIVTWFVKRALASLTPAPTQGSDMRRVCEELGFDPTNHHNAAKCPYCTPSPAPVSAPSPAGGVREAVDADEIEQRILGALDDCRDQGPDEGESWESWHYAAFDLASEKIAGLLTEFRAALSSSATPEPVPAPANGEGAAEILYERHRDRCRGHHGKRIMPAWKDALPETRALYREDVAALSNPAPGHGEGG